VRDRDLLHVDSKYSQHHLLKRLSFGIFIKNEIKKNEIMSFAGKWMELENIMLNEVVQT
jgi:hypothetical protein